ncbi:MAG: hypothetical protein R2750_08235 [Bacteroidales bacterium]
MKSLIIPILIILLALYSCNKDNSEPQIFSIENQIFAGEYNADLDLKEFNPPLKVDLISDSLLNFKYGVDSIDINTDGNYDLIIHQRFIMDWNDTVQISNTNYPFCSLTLKNGLEVACKNEIFYIGLGQTSSVLWVDSLEYLKRIDNLNDWSETNTNIWMWVVPPTSFWGSYGCWYNLIETEKYIGIRMKIITDYKFGWIKINQESRENFEFVSYAIEK